MWTWWWRLLCTLCTRPGREGHPCNTPTDFLLSRDNGIRRPPPRRYGPVDGRRQRRHDHVRGRSQWWPTYLWIRCPCHGERAETTHRMERRGDDYATSTGALLRNTGRRRVHGCLQWPECCGESNGTCVQDTQSYQMLSQSQAVYAHVKGKALECSETVPSANKSGVIFGKGALTG